MNAVLESGKAVAGAVHAPRLRVFKWLVRRELWEHRGIWIAPLICALIILFSAAVGQVNLGDTPAPAPAVEGLVVQAPVAGQWAGVALLGMAVPFYFTLLFTQFFYALNSLFDDRKDRSVLFWKSLPASDLETVLSKLFVASVVLPLVALLFTLGTQVLFALVAALRVDAIGAQLGAALGAGATVAAHSFVDALGSPGLWLADVATLLWVVFGFMLWTLPIVGYALLVSAATPRSPFVFAALLVAGLVLAESLLFGSDWFLGQLVAHAFAPIAGIDRSVEGAATMASHGHLPGFSDGQLLSSFTAPGLWAGVLVGVLFIGGAVWARRYRDENT
jgi:ABC-2 type transport system permease protein